MFTKQFLIGKRDKAFRRGIWYKTLEKIERDILNLTIRVVDKVESVFLGIVILKIIKKLNDVLKSRFSMKMNSFGIPKVHALTSIAVGWYNEVARVWVSDFGFVRYVTMIEVNK